MKNLLSTLTICSCIIGGSVGTASANEDFADKAVQSVNKVWNATFNDGDSAALAMLYSENATLSPGNGQVLVGREEIAELFKSFIDNGVNNHTISTIEIYRDNNKIVQLGKWQADGVNDKQQAISFGGVLMTVLVQNSKGEWETQSHIWNMGN
jgi:uncharacterized protein (TIGR02246 family)